jgi:hypothetical protein
MRIRKGNPKIMCVVEESARTKMRRKTSTTRARGQRGSQARDKNDTNMFVVLVCIFVNKNAYFLMCMYIQSWKYNSAPRVHMLSPNKKIFLIFKK